MTDSDKYVEALSHFHQLFALWSPEPSSRVKPGCCGYFDSQGDWNSIVDLNNKDKASKYDFDRSLPEPTPKGHGKWQPVCSKNIKWSRAALDAPIKIPELKVELKIKLEFSKEAGYGATLVTGPNITESFFENPKELFESWVKKNYRSISKRFLDVKQHGLWIITKVFVTPRCAISSWSDSEESACLYGSVNALVGSSLTVGGTLGEKKSGIFWRFLPDDESGSNGLWNCVKSLVRQGSGTNENQAGPYVVFVGALRYRMGVIRPKEVSLTSPLRGAEEHDDGFEIITDTDTIWIDCEDWGSTAKV